MTDMMPSSWNKKTKPHLFCPGCGHAIVLKQLGFAIDEIKIAKKVALGIDIGCSLLAWNFFNLDTIQTHHGRTTPTMVGYKLARPERIAISYTGDGGAYAIGLQSILHAAYRNNPVTVIVVNNENYAMTGGQISPTTEVGRITTTSPSGKPPELGPGLHGPELVREVAGSNSYIARASVSSPLALKATIKKALENQIVDNSFSFVEILSICPTNWKTNARDSFDLLREMEKFYPLGEVK